MADGDLVSAMSTVLPSLLEQAFIKVLQRDCDRELVKEAKEKEKRLRQQRKKKKTKKDSKKDKEREKKESEEKHVVREGNNSLIMYPNASCFSVSAHIRHFVQQQKLCDIYNHRYTEPSDEESSDEDDNEEKDKDQTRLPEVVGLGIRGVFTILKDVWQTIPELCLKVLNEFLNILQGQKPAGLKHEPQDTTTALFKLLVDMVSHSTEKDKLLAVQLSSLASACLVSLVIALGDTEKILEACATLLSAEPDLASSPVKIPQILHSLQSSVQAVLLGGVFETEWSKQGVPSHSLVEKWPLPFSNEDSSPAVVSDGSFIYLHGKFGLLKLGSGYSNTNKGKVYAHVKDFHTNESGWLGIVAGQLLFYPCGVGADVITVIRRDDLGVEKTMELDAEAVGRQCLFSDGADLRQLMFKKEGKCVLRKLTLLCSPVIVTEEKSLQLSQRSVLSLKKAKGDEAESLSALYQDTVEEVVRVITAKGVTAIQTESGKLFYTGNGSVFGMSGKDVPKGEWKAVELPDEKAIVKYVACDHTGSFSVIVDDKGVAYFAGANKKGESGEAAAGGRHPAKANKPKKMTKVKDHQILSCAANTHCSALVTNDGKLFLFGNIEDDIVDKSSGVVAGLLGVPVTQVVMGRSHTCILTQLGTVYSMGNNQYGQCGRNYHPPSDGTDVAMGEESDDEEEEDDAPCAPGEHEWKHQVCKICNFCGFCTGYGPSCCNEGFPGREGGADCGCGSGDSGCAVCGCCKVCGGEEDSWGGMDLEELQDMDEETFEKVQRVREKGRAKGKSKPKKKDKEEKVKEKKEEKKLQFGGAKADDSDEEEDDKEGEEEGKEEAEGPATKNPGLIPLPDDSTVMQLSCGTFHTALLLHSGEVYMFGNGNHGQLGQGTNKPCGHPVKVPLPGPASHVACGDNHTVVLLESGDIYSFGKHQEGQLGRLPDDPEDNSWNMSPGLVSISDSSCTPKWVSASGNQTFIGVEESLVSENTLSRSKVFANSECVGIVCPPAATGLRSKLVMLDLSSNTAKRLDGEEQQNLTNMSLCVDPDYDLLWGCGTSEIFCFNPLAAELKVPTKDTILSPSLCLPRSPDGSIMRNHAGLNLLFCLHTLSTSSSISSEALVAKNLKSFSVEDYHYVSRFNSQGGGWGYSHGSVEAFRFSPDQDILLGGFGLFGGRGNYSAEIKVFELGESADPEGEGNLLGSGQEKAYHCDRTKTYRLLFEKPVLLKADWWYVAYAAISSPSGASTDAGSSGLSSIIGPDSVTIKLRNSKRSNNGTDVASGQIPEILYRIPHYEQEKTVSVQLLDKSFYSTVTPDGLRSLQKLLEWSWGQYVQLADDEYSREEERLSLIIKACLGLFSSHIKEVYPEKGRSSSRVPDSLELAECVYNLLLLVQQILSRLPLSSGKNLPVIMAACQATYINCFHAFYPSPLLSWFALCHLMQRLDPSDVVAGFPLEGILSAVLEALSSPSLSFIGVSCDTTVSVQAALVNTEVSDRFPVLTSFMHEMVLEEHGHEELLSFTSVASKLLALVSVPLSRALAGGSLPSSLVIEKAAEFLLSRINELSLCSTYPEVARKNGLTFSQKIDKNIKLHESSARFKIVDAGLPSVEATQVVFSVNKPVSLTGYSLLGGTCTSKYEYNISLMKDDIVLATKEGSYMASDLVDGTIDAAFSTTVDLSPETVYKAVVEQRGESYCVGSDGLLLVPGPGDVVFTLHSTGSAVSNPETGTLNSFLYSSISTSSSNSVVNLSIRLATMLLDIGVNFLEKVFSNPAFSNEVLGSSFLFSTLLPATIAQLGPITTKDPKASVDVMSLVQQVLPAVSACANKLRQSEGVESPGYSDAKLMHYANVDTDHPYKQARVVYHRVVFPECVHWMTLEFDPRSGFAQSEDKIADLLIPRRNGCTHPSLPSNKNGNVSPMIDISFEAIYSGWRQFPLTCPAGLVLVPGNEVHIAVNTDTEYEKREENNHFGVKCKVIGYECSDDVKECLFQIEKELVSLGAMCAGSLLQKDIGGLFAEELPVGTDPSDTEKADMRLVQAAGHEVLSKHSHLLSRGLLAEPPSLSYVFQGEIPVINNSHEQQFLQEFTKSTPDTPGGRLARWLQPDRSVDPTASDLELASTDVPLRVGSQLKYTVRTRDQDKRLVYVEGMNVEVKLVWDGVDEEVWRVKAVDLATGVRRPTFKRPFNPTMLGTNHLYHSVSMMMPYSDYSFEELHFYAPKIQGQSEKMLMQNNKDGTYTASWVPSAAGLYTMHVCIEGSSSGEGMKVVIEPAERSDVQPTEPTEKKEEEEEEEEEEKVVVEKVKRKTFPGTLAQGVRVRSSPSFNGAQIGVIKPGNNLSYTEEITTSAGTWVKLTAQSLEDLNCTSTTEGYALAYNKDKDQRYLEEMEPVEVRRVVRKSPRITTKERAGGPGMYTVVQCGSAGHNLRSIPSMRGTPVGRLTKGSTVSVVQEEENDDGIWLKLAGDSARRYCEVESEAWTLAVHPSGRIFLTLEGDDFYKASLPQASASSQPSVFPTAASVFGTSQQPLFPGPLKSGTPPPTFLFGGMKLAFGADTKASDPSGVFRFSSSKTLDLKPLVGDKAKKQEEEVEKEFEDEEDEEDKPSLTGDSPVFSIGVLFGEKPKMRGRSPRRRRGGAGLRSFSPQRNLSDSSSEQKLSPQPSPAKVQHVESPTPAASQASQALSPAVAECQRAVFAAFLWQEGLVNDAIVSATYLKFHPGERDKQEEEEKASRKDSLPSTLSHLVTLWDEISTKVIENSSKPFTPPKVPPLAQELLKRYEEEKKEIEKLKKEKDKKPGGGGGGGTTKCELCDEVFPDPVTYHMKEAHSGCGRHASGWGYNSRGSYCSGWAGNCGDGGRGGSTWYLLCKDCHANFMSMKDEKRKKVSKPVLPSRIKTRKPGKPRSLPVVPAVQGMIKNSKFLLEVAWGGGDGARIKHPPTPQHDTLRQSSIPESEEVIEKRSSLPRSGGSEVPFNLPVRQPYFLRSASVATGQSVPISRTYSDSGEDGMAPPQLSRQATTGASTEAAKSAGSSLMTKPSMALANLMYLRSKQGTESGYSRVMHFVTRYHDLEGLRMTMKQAMRVAVLRACALEFLEWLLQQVEEAAVVHNILWHFMSALSSHPMLQAAAKMKAEKDEDEDTEGKVTKDLSLGRHPLAGLDGAGSALTTLRKQFHSFLQTIANTMGKLPVGSSAQQMALKCWCLDFQQADHSFLLQSKVFAGISEALSNMEDREGDRSPPSLTSEGQDKVELMEDVLPQGKLKVSSNDAMMDSLNDGSTETFWESRDEARDKPRSVTATFNKPIRFFAAAVHVDNQKDSGQRVECITLLIGSDEDSLKDITKVKLTSAHTGWKTILGPVDPTTCSVVRLEFKGVQKHVRVRQVQILAYPSKASEAIVPSVIAQQKDCEVEALRLFRLLTTKVFGGLLSESGEEDEGQEETDAGPTPTDEEEASSKMVNLLFTKNHLSSLQKQVCQHIIDSVHTEAMRIKEEWKTAIASVPSPPPPPPLPRSASKQLSTHDQDGASTKGKGTDTYCHELLSMLGGLSQSEPGCKFLVEQAGLLTDLISLLHTASSRLQLQVCSLLRRILPYIKPQNFAARTGVTVLPPLGYSAIAEAVNSAATINNLGLLDCFLAVISKAMSVQVKAKGRGSNVLQALTKESGATAVTLASLTSPKPVPGEGTVRDLRWYLHGSMDQEVAGEVVKLLKAMIEGGLKGGWKEFAKSAVGQAVLHLTKIKEDTRHVDPGIYSQTLWLCLAALCVINEEHADALSSGQWLGQDGKPHTKPLCDNHDDGETKALILCDKCGNLCGECDRVLHYHQRTSDHQRQVFKEEEEAVKVDLHEGCGRIKLYWTMVLADSRTLKGMVEFRDAIGGGGKGSCRFCGTASNTGLLAIGNVCADPECQERAKNVCQKTLPCGHLCCGVRDEVKCLPCLQGCAPKENQNGPPLKQDADDMCMICYTEGLSCAPCIQLECGHLFHYDCCRRALTKRWSGPRITFRFMFCSICEDKPISHPHLEDVTKPLMELYDDTRRKCQMRLEYENQSKCDAITSPSSKFYNKPLEYAMWKYAYYVCYKCKKAYYGGEAHCAEQAAVGDEYDPTELVCPACSHTGGGQAQICSKHGTDFLEYKCRYCCSVAVYYCFGTTHFCTACHDDFQRLTSMSKSDFPQCPVGPRARPLSGTECPLHVKHPPTGDEYALGCGVCRNAQTF